mmetsp:Transcript_70959/g.178971  ORF Transcript_70959/g.178971 Transcript_70959/m.178971 type:complete len:215 (+) Transcript_70959:65-709(+)
MWLPAGETGPVLLQQGRSAPPNRQSTRPDQPHDLLEREDTHHIRVRGGGGSAWAKACVIGVEGLVHVLHWERRKLRRVRRGLRGSLVHVLRPWVRLNLVLLMLPVNLSRLVEMITVHIGWARLAQLLRNLLRPSLNCRPLNFDTLLLTIRAAQRLAVQVVEALVGGGRILEIHKGETKIPAFFRCPRKAHPIHHVRQANRCQQLGDVNLPQAGG